MSPSAVPSGTAVKRVGGIKVVVRSKSKKQLKRKRTAATITGSLPLSQPQPVAAAKNGPASDVIPAIQLQDWSESSSVPYADDPQEDDAIHEDIPCDTLLAMRSLERASRCLFIPLQGGGFVPCVLESQLYDILQSQFEGDSSVTVELQQLCQSNQVRRLTSPNDNDIVTALIETRHYKRAVWDAHRQYDSADAKITSGFFTVLHHVTKRRIPKRELQTHWPSRVDCIPWNDQVMDTLVHMQVLLPSRDDYMLWLPQWGLVLKELDKSQTKILRHLQRSVYKELALTNVQRLSSSAALSGAFVCHTLVAAGKIELYERPSGTFCKLAKAK